MKRMRPRRTRSGQFAFAGLLLYMFLAAARARSQDVNASVLSTVAAHHGKVALYAAQLGPVGTPAAGRIVTLDADREVQTASDIKLAILYHALAEIRAGRAHWGETMTLQPGEAVGGSGMLHFFDTPLTLTLKDVLTMMVIVSDNTATNMAIDRFGIDPVNERMASLGLSHTHLYKKVMKPASGPLPPDQAKFGLGKTTPREMAALMTDIAECRIRPDPKTHALLSMDDADRAICAVAFSMLKSQFYRETIPRFLPGGGEGAVLSKTGSLDAVRNDVAVISGKSGPMVLAIFTYDNADHGWTVDNEGEMTIAKLSRALVDAWSPGGLDAEALKPGLASSNPQAAAEDQPETRP